MKYLIIILSLAFSTLGFSQMGILEKNENISVIYVPYETNNDIIKLLYRYELECYNDSTLVISHECPNGNIGCLVYHTQEIIEHKTPTLQGFIKWLKEQ